jgi:hypothetical protein
MEYLLEIVLSISIVFSVYRVFSYAEKIFKM